MGMALAAGCTEYRPVHQRDGETWLQAVQLAYRDDIAKHPVGQSSGTGPRPFAIGPGQHLVMEGETLSELAAQYRVSQTELASLNRIRTRDRIYVGQVLVLPEDSPAQSRITQRGTATNDVQVAAIEPSTSTDGVLVVDVPIPTRNADSAAASPRPTVKLEEPVYPTHTVRPGESLALIGERYGYNLGEMLSVNQHLDPAKLRAGQQVNIPDDSRAVYGASRPKPMDDQTRARIKQASESAPPPLTGEGFLSPLNGELVGRFGGLANGMRNDGINIAAPEGTPVKAAENGVVVYVGHDVGDFGKLLLVRHAGEFVTAYGHNSRLVVKVGDVVARGQTIAFSGATGVVSQPQLHFQIRQGSTPIDPRTRLVRAGGSRQG